MLFGFLAARMQLKVVMTGRNPVRLTGLWMMTIVASLIGILIYNIYTPSRSLIYDVMLRTSKLFQFFFLNLLACAKRHIFIFKDGGSMSCYICDSHHIVAKLPDDSWPVPKPFWCHPDDLKKRKAEIWRNRPHLTNL
jgi:hypothetical protein